MFPNAPPDINLDLDDALDCIFGFVSRVTHRGCTAFCTGVRRLLPPRVLALLTGMYSLGCMCLYYAFGILWLICANGLAWLSRPRHRFPKLALIILLLYLNIRLSVVDDREHPNGHLAETIEDITFDIPWSLTLSPSALGAIQATLREPTLVFSACLIPYVLFVITVAFFHFYVSAALNHFAPMFYRHQVDRLLPPETIKHRFRGKDGYKEYDARQIRDLFTPDQFMLDRAHLSTDPSHTHPKAAQRRAAAVNMVEALCKRNGLNLFDDEMSNRSQKRGHKGTRVIADVKDAWSYTSDQLKYDNPQQTCPGQTVQAHIDTFTHKKPQDANNTLSNGNIHFLYTWNPSAVAGNSDEQAFRYDEEGQFITTGANSIDYHDDLWDFEGDGVSTSSFNYEFSYTAKCCILLTCVIFTYNLLCDHQENSDLHSWYFGYWRWLKYEIPYPVVVWRVYQHTNAGIVAAITNFVNNFGLPVAWRTLLNGYAYPSYDWRVSVWQYPWGAQPTSMTSTQWYAMAALLGIAANSCLNFVIVVHRVLRIDVGESRCVVLIVPNNKFKGLGAVLRPFLLDAALKRRKPHIFSTKGGHVAFAHRFKKRKDVPAHYSAAYLGSHIAHFIPDDAVDTTKSLTTAKSDPSLSNVRVSTKAEGGEISRNAAALTIALTHLADNNQQPMETYSYTHVPTVVRQDEEEEADGVEVKDIQAHRAMNPIIEGCDFVHANTRGACLDTVKRRLREPADKVKDYTMTPEFAKYIHEFAGHIVREVIGVDADQETECGTLDLYDEGRYIEERNKTQLRKFQEVQDVYDIDNLEERQGFLKREVLAKPHKPARGICTFSPEQQAIGGRVALAYAEALKACNWIGCGQNPKEIIESVLRVCSGADFINATDFTAQDATVTLVDRQIELYLLKCLFDKDHHEVIENWHWTDYCGRVLYGSPGTKRVSHDFDGSRGSGSPFTTFGNTPLTGLYAYIALRKDGFDPSAAYAKLGIYSGDDGITANVSATACDKAAEIMGFIVKSEICETYVPYLGRIFHDPIEGSTSSIQDPKRTLGKLATTLCDPNQVTAHESMLLKAMCLQVTDRNSDFFGDWSKKMLEDAGQQQQQALKSRLLKFENLHPYFAITGLKTKTTFDNHPGDFEELFETQMPGFDWSKFHDWVANGTGQCPTLWKQPEPTDEEMEAVGPVRLCMNGVNDEANTIPYERAEELTPPKATVKPRSNSDPVKRRNKSEMKELTSKLKEAGLLADYRAAKIDPKLTPEENRVRTETRRRLVREVESRSK